jgi:hypothetical protein
MGQQEQQVGLKPPVLLRLVLRQRELKQQVLQLLEEL